MHQFFTVGDWLHGFVVLWGLVCFVVQHAKITVFFPDGYMGDLVPSLIQGGCTAGIMCAVVFL